MPQKLEAMNSGGRSTSIRVGTVGTIGSLMNRELGSTSRTYPSSSSSKTVTLSTSLEQRKSMDKAAITGTGASTSSIKHRGPENIKGGMGQSHQNRIPVLGAMSAKRQKQKASPPHEGRRSSRRNPPELSSKITRSHKRAYRIPMLGSDSISSLDGTPIREKRAGKKGINIVEVVDVHCGGISGGALTNRLKKLGFSKLSQSMI